MKEQVLQMIQNRIDNLKREKQRYLKDYYSASKILKCDEANKCYRWYREISGRIEELEELAININRGLK